MVHVSCDTHSPSTLALDLHTVSNSRSLSSLEFPIIPNVVHGGDVPPLGAAQGLLRAWGFGYPNGRRDQGGSGEKK